MKIYIVFKRKSDFMSVTVIIPVFNGSKTITETLRSLHEQTQQIDEIIIVDDGSTDNTFNTVKEYTQGWKNVVYLSQENNGVSSARNFGLKHATSKYVSFIDSDDTYDRLFVEKMFKKITIDDYDIAYSGYNDETPNNIVRRNSKFSNKNTVKKYILGTIAPASMCWLMKRSYLNNNSLAFNEDISWGEDVEFYCDVLLNGGKVTFVPEYLSYYKVGFHDDHLSNYDIKKIDLDYESMQRINNKVVEYGDYSSSKAILNYRLPALVVYNLNNAINKGENYSVINTYYIKYRKNILGFSYVNTLRSIKLNLVRLKLIIKMIKIGRYIK